MARNMMRSQALVLFGISLFILSAFQTSAVRAQAIEGVAVNQGDYAVYSTSASATYRMYAGNSRIVVTDNTTFPFVGNLDIVSSEDDEWVASESVAGLELVPYVITITGLENGTATCPFEGYNTSRSALIEAWDAEHLTFNVTGNDFVYADVERTCTELEYTYNYTLPNRLNESRTDLIESNIICLWDNEFGVLVEYNVTITNFNDSSMDGLISMSLVETSLWALDTGSVPGYSTELMLGIIGLTMGVLIKKKRIGVPK